MKVQGLHDIQLNPLGARIDEDIEARSYPSTGHASLMANATYRRQDEVFILSVFGASVSEARVAYLDSAFGTLEDEPARRGLRGCTG